MKTITLLLALVTGTAALAQDNPPAPPAPASAAPRQFVYLAQLPTPAELVKDAQAEGMTVSRIEQADDQVIVTYQYADGSAKTFAYKLLSSVAGIAPTTQVIEKVTVVETVPPPPRVVYVDEPEVVYYSSPGYVRYYDPYYYPRVNLGINLGFRSGGYYRGSYGGYSGGRHSSHGHGGHRGGGGRRH